MARLLRRRQETDPEFYFNILFAHRNGFQGGRCWIGLILLGSRALDTIFRGLSLTSSVLKSPLIVLLPIMSFAWSESEALPDYRSTWADSVKEPRGYEPQPQNHLAHPAESCSKPLD
ncbi:hypothetical protein PAPYR_6483 [Paratrimastix pyriformis]|uniref:Uncharacterized protein n=1 Tax=Paratrimastix pyriformis TaxID=342808 RepID=A0ABQ8UJ40_9EUKA|nr:hypothetical protein PAPYR_6483 [Paratrimastix pyriformis]